MSGRLDHPGLAAGAHTFASFIIHERVFAVKRSTHTCTSNGCLQLPSGLFSLDHKRPRILSCVLTRGASDG